MINYNLLILVLQGALLTITVSLLAMFFGMLLAIVFVALQKTPIRLISWTFEVLLTLLRGLPEIVMVFLVYYGGSQLFAEFDLELTAFTAGVSALSIVFAAYASQSMRGAIESIPAGQWQAGQALGLTKTQIFFSIIIPQMWRQALPGLTNQWLSLLKDSSLVSIIGIGEIMFYTNSVIKVTHSPFTWYLIAAALYIVITLISNRIIALLDRCFNYYLQPAK